MTAPELQRMITREVIERQAEQRHRQLAREVAAIGGRVAVVHRHSSMHAELWPTSRQAGRALGVVAEQFPISWIEFALNKGWISETGHQAAAGDGSVWVAYVLTPAGRRFAAELGRDELLPPLPGQG
jgi:hypothetical protein